MADEEPKSAAEVQKEATAAIYGKKTAGQDRADTLAKEKLTDVTPIAKAAAAAKTKRDQAAKDAAAAKPVPSPSPSPRSDTAKSQGVSR